MYDLKLCTQKFKCFVLGQNLFILDISIAPELSSNTREYTLASVDFTGIKIVVILLNKLIIGIVPFKA